MSCTTSAPYVSVNSSAFWNQFAVYVVYIKSSRDARLCLFSSTRRPRISTASVRLIGEPTPIALYCLFPLDIVDGWAEG